MALSSYDPEMRIMGSRFSYRLLRSPGTKRVVELDDKIEMSREVAFGYKSLCIVVLEAEPVFFRAGFEKPMIRTMKPCTNRLQ